MTLSFGELGLPEFLLRALENAEHHTPTPIQAMAIPHALAGSDLLGIAQTGTGKTGAFALPALARRLTTSLGKPPANRPRTLILTPTRELALQVAEAVRLYSRGSRLRSTTVVGGVSQRAQTQALARGIDVLVATPGRLIDLIDQGCCDLADVDTLVLDEADRMLDLGFQKPILRLADLSGTERQTLLFSATMPPMVERFAAQLLSKPVRVEVEAPKMTLESIDQRVQFVDAVRKRSVVLGMLQDPDLARVIVFARTKRGAQRLADDLVRADIAADAIHGDKPQNARQRALSRFRDGRARVLVATDVAARGIDVPDVSHVINYNMPDDAETYVHRIGRTGRAGRSGVAMSLCAPDERDQLRAIERLTGQDLGLGGTRSAGNPSKNNRKRPTRAPRHRSDNGGRRRHPRAA